MASEFKYDVFIIGGLGHIGLPLGIALAESGLEVGLYDINMATRSLVENGVMPFLEYDAEPILKRVIGKTLLLANTLEEVRMSDCVIITIGTPLDDYLNPAWLPILELSQKLICYLYPGQHIMLRSTVFPGTSQRLKDFFESRGLDVHLSFCPERVVQGYAIRELGRFPQIISGFSKEACDQAEALFSHLKVKTIKVSVQEAELAKLFLNSWRYIQFAIANQFYVMASEANLDFFKIHRAMTWEYDRANDFPLPGFTAGPCLLKDTMQLSAYDRNHFLLGHAAMLLNEGLPDFVVRNLKRAHKLAGTQVGILGMAFKANVDDVRDSLAYKLRKLLQFEGATVLCSDEFIKDPSFVSKEELIERCSIIILGVPHALYQTLRIPDGTHMVDVWGFFTEQQNSDRSGT